MPSGSGGEDRTVSALKLTELVHEIKADIENDCRQLGNVRVDCKAL